MNELNRAELRRLAEAFPSDLDWDSNHEPFFNGPSGESLGGGADGTYAVYGKPFRLDGEDYDYDGPTYVERCGADFAKFMVKAKEGVLSLLDQCEGLMDQHARDSATLRELCQARDDAKKERDAALAELESLRIQVGTLTEWYSNALDVIAEVTAAIPGVTYMDLPDGGDVSIKEQIRRMAKDAERYRQLRDGSGWPAVFDNSDDPEPLRGNDLDAAISQEQAK